MERFQDPGMTAAKAWAARLFAPLRRAALAWSVLLTVLICALAPAGLPHTATQGSAFNPATTSVALHAKAPRERLLGKHAIEPAKPGAGTHAPTSFVAAILPVPPLTERRIASGAAALPSGAAHALPSIPHALPWARGPPLA